MIPVTFHFFLSGPPSRAFKLTQLEPYLPKVRFVPYYLGNSEARPMFFSPSPERWAKFRKYLDEMAVWNKKEPGHHGPFWEFLAYYGDKDCDFVSIQNGSLELLEGLTLGIRDLSGEVIKV